MQNTWVCNMEKKLGGAELPATVEKWPKHCIFRVPPHFKAGSNVLFKPKMVALGPFHHKDAALRPMEEHKLRAVQHLLRRSGKTLGDLAAAVEAVAADLEDAYAKLGDRWRGQYRDRFLQMMIADGCFLLEFMRIFTGKKISGGGDYSPDDPVFGRHAVKNTAVFVIGDMLMIENQLPLILLRTIVAVETGQTPSDSDINELVLGFLDPKLPNVPSRLGLHPLDLYRRALLLPPQHRNPSDQHMILRCCLPMDGHIRTTTMTTLSTRPPLKDKDDDGKDDDKGAPRSAQKLYEAGIWFRRRNDSDCLDNIRFKKRSCNALEMPRVMLDDSTEYKYRNMMAFEALHAGVDGDAGDEGNHVTAFVLFMRDLVDSTDDVELLRNKGILDHDLAGGDRAVVSLLNRLTRDVAKLNKSKLCAIRSELENYCVNRSWVVRVLVCKSWAKLRTSHLANIWTFIALLAGIFLLGTDIVQTVFAVKSYNHDANK